VRQLAAALLRRKLASGSGSSKLETQKRDHVGRPHKGEISAVCAGNGLLGVLKVGESASGTIRAMPVDIRHARYGVQEYWIIDPYGPSAEIYRRQKRGFDPVRTLGATHSLTSPLFPGFSLPLRNLVE